MTAVDSRARAIASALFPDVRAASMPLLLPASTMRTLQFPQATAGHNRRPCDAQFKNSAAMSRLSNIRNNNELRDHGRRGPAAPTTQALYGRNNTRNNTRHTSGEPVRRTPLTYIWSLYILTVNTWTRTTGRRRSVGERQVDIQAFTKGLNELLVLGALGAGPRHGYQIVLDVERRSGGRFVFQHGTLYPILHRLEAEGLIAGRWEEGAGRRRKAYRITAAGRRRISAELRRVEEVLHCVMEIGGEQADDALSDAS
jgi:PadR family transcriptional regulator, regulatory protein PadR